MEALPDIVMVLAADHVKAACAPPVSIEIFFVTKPVTSTATLLHKALPRVKYAFVIKWLLRALIKVNLFVGRPSRVTVELDITPCS